MPKRKNPFGDTAPIQLKTHVGFNQAATEADKQAVYERTKALLFRGANPNLKHTPQNVENVPPPGQCNGTRLFDDIHTLSYPSSNGDISEDMHTEQLTPSLDVPVVPQQQGILRYFGNGAASGKVMNGHSVVCGSCHCGGVELVMVCGGCGRSVCGVEGCLRQCNVCQRVLCQLCTVLNYTEREVRTFCFDCLPMIT